MSVANQYEQQMLRLINAERAAVGLPPLVLNNELNAVSEQHTEWMLETDTFSHTGENGSRLRDRVEDSDYELSGSWKIRENIAWEPTEGDDGISDEVVRLHENLMNSPGHRQNILDPDIVEIGIGIERGEFINDEGKALDAVMVTQVFGRNASSPTVTATPEEPAQDAVEEAPVVVEAPAPIEAETPAPVEATAPTPVEVEAPAPVVVEQPAPAPVEEPETTIPTNEGTQMGSDTIDIMSFLQSRGFRMPEPSSDDGAPRTTTTTTSSMGSETLTSSVEVESVASEIDGPSVEIEGEGNFSGAGGATVEDETVTDSASNDEVVATPVVEETVVEEVVVEAAAPVAEAPAPAPAPAAPAPAFTAPTFDISDFMSSFGSNATGPTGSTMSISAGESVASSDNGPTVTNTELSGNATFDGVAVVEDEQDAVSASTAPVMSSVGFSSFNFADFFSF